LSGGSGFSAASPPSIIIRDNDGTVQPKGPQGIIAEASATINDAGQITAIDVISAGRNYLSTQNIVVDVEGIQDWQPQLCHQYITLFPPQLHQ
jgi:hypothetical protein